MFIMTLFIFAFIWFLYLFVPNTANIYLKTDQNGFRYEISSNRLDGSYLDDMIRVSDFDNITLEFDSDFVIEVEDKRYSSDYIVVIENADIETDSLTMTNVLEGNPISLSLNYNSVNHPKDHIEYRRWQDAFSYLRIYNNIHIIPNADVMFKFRTDKNGVMYLVEKNQKGSRLEIDSFILRKPSNPIRSFHITSLSDHGFEIDIYRHNYTAEALSDHGFLLDLIFQNVYATEQILSGSVKFSTTPKGETYGLDNQEVRLDSQAHDLRITLRANIIGVSSVTSGMVDKAVISGMSLFPSFSNWYTENLLFAPLTLVSIVFGGVALMFSKKKSPKENNTDNKMK